MLEPITLEKSMNRKLPTWFNVVPCVGKIPQIKWAEFCNRYPTIEEKAQWPKTKDCGIITGAISRLFVLDDDGSPELKNYSLPVTPTVKTPRGGKHYYFTWVPELDGLVTTRTGVLEKVDIRGNGGFVAFYGWEKSPDIVPFAKPPKWLIEKLGEKNADKLPISISQKLEEIKQGNRNETFTSLAGSLWRRGYEREDIFKLLLSQAKELAFSESELWTICSSVGRYSRPIISGQGESVDKFLEDVERVDWICEPIIAKKTLGFIAGLPSTMKTWIMIDLAVEAARRDTGGFWLGKFPVKPAKVLFIDQERFKGETQRRFRAVIAGKNINPKDLRESLFIRCGSTTRINLETSYNAFKKELEEIKPDIVIIDSFVTFHTKEENNRTEIQEVLEKIKALRTDYNTAILFLDHENKGAFNAAETNEEPSSNRMAGSIAKPAAAELVLSVRRHDVESCFVYHTKPLASAAIPPFQVRVTDTAPNGSKIEVRTY